MIELRRIEYLSAHAAGPVRRKGEAIQLPKPWSDIRLVLRELDPLERLWHYERPMRPWKLEHFSSGASIELFVPRTRSRASAVRALMKMLRAATPEQLERLRNPTVVSLEELQARWIQDAAPSRVTGEPHRP